MTHLLCLPDVCVGGFQAVRTGLADILLSYETGHRRWQSLYPTSFHSSGPPKCHEGKNCTLQGGYTGSSGHRVTCQASVARGSLKSPWTWFRILYRSWMFGPFQHFLCNVRSGMSSLFWQRVTNPKWNYLTAWTTVWIFYVIGCTKSTNVVAGNIQPGGPRVGHACYKRRG